jgi:tetratricopeptide (TPR) repeat protein
VLIGARGLGSSVDGRAETPASQYPWGTTPFEPGETPHRIGRFTILELIGTGGMGVVYAAFDNELDRKVALKLVRTELRDEKPEATRQAMAREAKAMAKIDHPNVITVFEVGTHEDQIYVAMELVGGGDLRAWLKRETRTWRDVLAACVQAGQGLAAAHRANLVHRDFKPDNVLVGADGRVRVTDFGLARVVGDSARPSIVDVPRALADISTKPPMRPSERLTRTGAVVGTPAYMAPEQHRGEAADARSDQFAFCVTAWEALFGQRPFAGDDFAAIANAVRKGEVREPPASDVPQRIREALRRGLRTSPTERFATMDELLAELALEKPRTRKLLLLAAIPAVLAIGAGAWLALRPDDKTCPTAESKLAGLWDAERRAETSAAIRAGGAPYGTDLAAATVAAIDRYTQQWSVAWGEACAARERGTDSPAMFDLRTSCLMRRLHAVDAIANALAKREPAIVQRAGALVEGLAPIDTCSSAENLAKAAPPPELFVDVAAIDDLLEQAQHKRMAADVKGARELALRALAEAERIGFKPSIATALLVLARLEYDEGDYAAAEKLLQRASGEAMAGSYDELVADVLTELADLVGYDLARPAEAHRLVEIARGAIGRIGNPPAYRIDLLTTQSRIFLLEAKHEPSMAALEEATAIAKQIGDEMRLIPILSAKGRLLLEQGKFDEAFVVTEQEREMRARIEGKRHPLYASVLESRATIHFARNAFETGLADLAEARRIKIDALGPDTPELLSVENNAGIIAGLLGDWNEALRSARVCHAIAEKQHGLVHPATALAISNEGSALRELGKLDEAEPLIVQALDLRKQLFGAEHADYAVSLTEVGELRLAQNRPKDAAKLFADAEQILLASIGEESPLIPYATWGLGVAQLRLGDARAAKATLARTLARFEELDLDPIQTSETRLSLADATLKLGDKAAARALVEGTAPLLAKLPPGTNAVLREKIATWLAKH